jgi:hypothetical protein
MHRLARFGFGFAFILSACAPRPLNARHTVIEYAKDPALRQAELEECWSDPGSHGADPDCINAQRAELLERHGKSLRDLPPLDLDRPRA